MNQPSDEQMLFGLKILFAISVFFSGMMSRFIMTKITATLVDISILAASCAALLVVSQIDIVYYQTYLAPHVQQLFYVVYTVIIPLIDHGIHQVKTKIAELLIK